MRLFVAVGLPGAIREQLLRMCAGVRGARWVNTEQMHLTLRFLGELHTAQADDAAERLAQIRAPGFDLLLAGIGSFAAGDRLRVLWVGVEACPALGRLQAKVERAARAAGLGIEARRFHPHVTLARFRNGRVDLSGYLQTYEPFRAGPVPVREFALYSSHLGPAGATYREEMRFPLATPPRG